MWRNVIDNKNPGRPSVSNAPQNGWHDIIPATAALEIIGRILCHWDRGEIVVIIQMPRVKDLAHSPDIASIKYAWAPGKRATPPFYIISHEEEIGRPDALLFPTARERWVGSFPASLASIDCNSVTIVNFAFRIPSRLLIIQTFMQRE